MKMIKVEELHKISIHALREEGDAPGCSGRWQCPHFYPRPPRGGRRFVVRLAVELELFLSTPSARRATLCGPPAPSHFGISIHALREEGD